MNYDTCGINNELFYLINNDYVGYEYFMSLFYHTLFTLIETCCQCIRLDVIISLILLLYYVRTGLLVVACKLLNSIRKETDWNK